MRLLILGSGGREHALAWRLARDPGLNQLICAPGNPGMTAVATCRPASLADPDSIASLAGDLGVDLTIVGPEAPLAAGLVDLFEARGLAIVGPRQAAAELESSKAFAKDFMVRHQVPTARHRLVRAAGDAKRLLDSGEFGYPVVLKADGLAAGKGVVVAADRAEASAAVDSMMVERRFGQAGATLVVEEFLRGREASFFVLTDGRKAVELPSAEDHKRAFDADHGPNTGGMGAFAPSPLMTDEMRRRVVDEIVHPVLAGMREEGREYRGFLYVGLMLTAEGPKVVEFNVRLGDPETQVVLPLVGGELLPLLEGAARGRLDADRIETRAERAVGVVLASGGYPDAYKTGMAIGGVGEAEAMDGVLVFHAGTAARDGALVTAGGRVLTVVGRGTGFPAAIDAAYRAAGAITFEGMHMRRDIGRRAVEGR